MVHGGQRWVPPPMTTLAEPLVVDDRTAAQKGGPDGTDGRPRERERPLTDSERDRFEDMLRFLTVRRKRRSVYISPEILAGLPVNQCSP